MPLSIVDRREKKQTFLHDLTTLYHLMTYSEDKEKISDQFSSVIATVSHFETELLPYSVASQFIYQVNGDDMEYFFQFFEDELEDRISNSDPDEPVFKKAIKLFEHLELANFQKEYLFKEQEEKIASIAHEIKDYGRIKDELEKNFKDTKTKFEGIESSVDNLTLNLISILGIFAAILLGAYGSIQGFSNVFGNANEISLGKILVLSSVGASAVLVILFFLLNSIARLTNKSLSNSGDDIITKFPSLIFSHTILGLVFVIGITFELIKNNVKPDYYWLWLFVFLFALIQVALIYKTKSLWGILNLKFFFRRNEMKK